METFTEYLKGWYRIIYPETRKKTLGRFPHVFQPPWCGKLNSEPANSKRGSSFS